MRRVDTTITKDTDLLFTEILTEKFNQVSKEYWRHEEVKQVLNACDELGLFELRKKLQSQC